MKLEAFDKKKGMSVWELQEAVNKLAAVVEATGQETANVYVKAWVNMSAGIKSLEV